MVGVVLPNSPHYLEVWWAILWLGGDLQPGQPGADRARGGRHPRRLRSQTRRLHAEAAAGLEEHREELPALREIVAAEGTDPPRRCAATAASTSTPRSRPDDLAAFVYTSGTTGRPKGAMLGHANFLANAWQLGEPLPVTRGDTLGHGAAAVPRQRPAGDDDDAADARRPGGDVGALLGLPFWADVARFEPVTFSSVPTMLAALLHAPGADEAEANTLRFVICGAAPLSPALFRRFEEKFGLKIMEGYGLTEGTCCTTINPFTGPRKIGSVGAPDARARRWRSSTRTASPSPTASRGEVCFRGPNMMHGYYKRPDANAETMRDGWLHTGDVGYRDEDGYFFLVDRTKDMIIRGGENIYPREIEDVLLEHDGGQGGRGDRPPRRSPRRGGARRRRARLRRRHSTARGALPRATGAFKVPSSWEVVDELPKTSTGKIDKKPLREKLAAAAG